RALISVSDKTGLIEFSRALIDLNIEIVSTGGTAMALRAAGIAVTEVSSITGFPEIMDGRVKTLHPRIHGGLLGVLDNPDHETARKEHDIVPIGLLVVNLYPFEKTVAGDPEWAEAIENIDVGGPAMIRAGAKNHGDVTVIVDPADYGTILAELKTRGSQTDVGTRRRLAAKAFARTAAYDSAISQWLVAEQGLGLAAGYFTTGGAVLQSLRYGENPHQEAILVATPGGQHGITAVRQVQGKELSYNNINDTDAALECLAEFDAESEAACVIVKHANPCGVAVAATPLEAYQRALACDPVSAFGGIIAFNRELDGPTAAEIAKLFTEVIVVPAVNGEGLAQVSAKKNLRLLVLDRGSMSKKGFSVKSVAGGLLVQSMDSVSIRDMELRVVSKREPSLDELKDLKFAFQVAKHVKSNAIVYAKNGATVGIGAGQMSRVDSSRIAVAKARDSAGETTS
ncbi:MAG: bifunctional phosphoribosylaminoimidazolecarboxamide formyltransferase/IMP cyclohydrolase, partial [Alphaproteobacteria bacterium]|nr:bifunctional phosphoribosylaminoimidazolecarboxamide formyltransferase/IMP cyclohydrolase [Alphaproteobacteria bacterium]